MKLNLTCGPFLARYPSPVALTGAARDKAAAAALEPPRPRRPNGANDEGCDSIDDTCKPLLPFRSCVAKIRRLRGSSSRPAAALCSPDFDIDVDSSPTLLDSVRIANMDFFYGFYGLKHFLLCSLIPCSTVIFQERVVVGLTG